MSSACPGAGRHRSMVTTRRACRHSTLRTLPPCPLRSPSLPTFPAPRLLLSRAPGTVTGGVRLRKKEDRTDVNVTPRGSLSRCLRLAGSNHLRILRLPPCHKTHSQTLDEPKN